MEIISDPDHLPMQTDIHHSAGYQPVFPHKPKCQRNEVHWDSFKINVDKKISNLPPELNLSKRLARFTNILNSVAYTHVGKIKLLPKAKPWITNQVQAKILTRNRIQRIIKTNQ